MSTKLRVALIGGPMYEAVSDAIRGDVEVVVEADHLTLNSRVAELLAAGERLDVISTHAKYAPSQRQWLRPLQHLVAPSTLGGLEAGALALCRSDDDLWCVPRNIDVRVLWWRSDRMAGPPDTWAELLDSDAVFGCCGRGSGLFGMFFELVVGAGGELFHADGRPQLTTDAAAAAIDTIAALARRCPQGPDGITSWHYDDVDAALCAGVVDLAASWPSATTELRSSAVGGRLRPAPYPAGASRRVSYSGCHGWAIPTTCGDLDAAVALVARLCGPEIHRIEASIGGVPARSDVLAALEPSDDVDQARLDICRRTIADAMITYPPLPRFPQLEDRGAAAITAVLTGQGSVADATDVIRRELDAVTRGTTPPQD